MRKISAFAYHFWMPDMKPLRGNNGNQHLHPASPEYRDQVKRKPHAYHAFIPAGIVCQGSLQYLAVASPQIVWNCFGSCLRTVRSGISPSELFVPTPLGQHLPESLLNSARTAKLDPMSDRRRCRKVRVPTLTFTETVPCRTQR